jgi:putative endopeptidase
MKRIAVLLAVLMGSAAPAQMGAQTGAQTGLPAGVDTAGMDRSTRPGNDFEQYANGGWRAGATIPPDRSSIGTFRAVFDLSETRLAALIADTARRPAAAGAHGRRIADYYAAYNDTAGIEARGTAPIRPQLAAIEGLRDKAELSRMLGANVRADVDVLNATNLHTPNIVGLWVTQALEEPGRTVPYVVQGGLGMPDRDYYLSNSADMRTIRTAYQAYVARLFELAGYRDAPARAARVVELESKIAGVHATVEETENAHHAEGWVRRDFAARAPGIDWRAFWASAGLPKQDRFMVWQPQALIGLSALVASEPLQAWQDWLAFHAIDHVATVLPAAFDQAQFDFYGKHLTGAQAQRPRDKRAIAATNAALGDAIGRLYAQRYFPASSKADIQAMVSGILKAFDTRVANLDWMAPATKAEARRKIETMRVGIGYPDTWRDYRALVVRADDPVGNMIRAEQVRTGQQLAKIGRPVDRGEWWMTPQTVNAVNLPLQNALNFPAAILEAPFYDPHRDAAANYGAIGSIIGHEISHSFDNTGADFDASGKMRNWWTPADLARFQASGAALAAQYDAYEPFPGLHVNGKQTLGENIADVAGLTAAQEAYHASLGGGAAPVIDGMTGDQRLFLAFAQGWRQKTRDAAAKAQLATDGHAPARYRAFTVRNLDAWYAAFGVKPGDAMYLAPDKRVHLW